jgi:Fic family protein
MTSFVQDLGKWSEKYLPPVAAAMAHFGLISIHPFDDGNGRTARLLADMVLHQKGWSIDGMLSISKVILDDRQEYYRTLRETQGEVFAESIDATPFVRFHTNALGIAAASLEDRTVLFNKRRDRLMKEIPNLSSRQVTGLMFMLDIGPVSTSTYAGMVNVSQPTALADLAQLIDWGMVIREGAGRNTRYRLHPTLASSVQGQ